MRNFGANCCRSFDRYRNSLDYRENKTSHHLFLLVGSVLWYGNLTWLHFQNINNTAVASLVNASNNKRNKPKYRAAKIAKLGIALVKAKAPRNILYFEQKVICFWQEPLWLLILSYFFRLCVGTRWRNASWFLKNLDFSLKTHLYTIIRFPTVSSFFFFYWQLFQLTCKRSGIPFTLNFLPQNRLPRNQNGSLITSDPREYWTGNKILHSDLRKIYNLLLFLVFLCFCFFVIVVVCLFCFFFFFKKISVSVT